MVGRSKFVDARHFKIKTRIDRFRERIAPEPVRHDKSIRFPLLADQVLEEPRVFGAMKAIELSVATNWPISIVAMANGPKDDLRSHKCPWLRVFLGKHEGQEVNLAERSLAENGVQSLAVIFLVIGTVKELSEKDKTD